MRARPRRGPADAPSAGRALNPRAARGSGGWLRRSVSGGRLAELALLALALLAPLLPAPAAVLALAALGALWLRSHPPPRELVLGVVALVVAAVALAAGWTARALAAPPAPGHLEHEERQYAYVWDALQREGVAGAQALIAGPGSPLAVLDPPVGSQPPSAAAVRLATRVAFSRLNRLAPSGGSERRALLLIDPVGNTVAWAGEGLVHEPGADAWPRSGFSYRAGFNAVTLLAAEPLRDQGPGWRVVAGASYPTDRLPRAPLCTATRSALGSGLLECGRGTLVAGLEALQPRPLLRWALADNAAQIHAGALEVERLGAPTLVIDVLAPTPLVAAWLDRVAWAVLALFLLAIAVMRGVGAALPEVSTISGPRERRGWIAILALAGILAAGELAGLRRVALLALLLGAGLSALGLTVGRRRGPAGPAGRRTSLLFGGLAACALVGGAWLVQTRWGPLDVADGILTTAEGWAFRLAVTAAAFGLLLLAGRGPDSGQVRERASWPALLVLLAAAVMAGSPWVALALLIAGGAAGAALADGQERRRGTLLAPLVVLSALLGAASWEAAERLRLERYSAGELLNRFARPSPAELAGLKSEIDQYFAGLDLESLTPRVARGLDTSDLAYALWRGSPLGRPSTLSAIVVQAKGMAPSSFSFGLAVGRSGDADAERFADLPGWEHTAVAGTAVLRREGQPWGNVRFWLLPRPGFQARDPRRLTRIEVGLLRGGPALAAVETQIAPAVYALYSAPDGRAVLSPWDSRPPLPAGLRQPRSWPLETDTPVGAAQVTVRALRDAGPAPVAWEAVYLPDEDLPSALERAGNWVVGLVLALALAVPFAMLLALPRASFRELLWRSFHSYSRRLLILFTALLLVPLLLLNLVLVSSVEQSMVSARSTAGEAALRAAQELLAKEIGALPPGFVFDPATFDPEMGSIATVVQHEVNLYWRSGLSASSKHELFTAGLLPKRIPGEIYGDLALAGRNLGARTNHAADVPYLELYAPLQASSPDKGREPELFLSVPLLAQQEESARQLAHLRAHGVLVTVFLFLLLAALGSRLARNFTRPLMQLVEGTRRIAAGATSLDLAPSELELAALVRAVDDMARRIAEGRERLVREKQVVERMVNSITSGVVSLDRERRVLMHNRVATELLGVGVGQNLERAVRQVPRLKPVAAFLSTVGGEMARTTVRLGRGAEEREWSLVWVPLPGAGEPFALLVVEDATEELRGQRLAAWAEMARMIAHEIKNPLTPIRLSAEHMREVYRSDPEHFGAVFEHCTANILTQVEELRSIAGDFSTYSAIPRIDPQPGDLAQAVGDLVAGYRAAPPRGVEIAFAGAGTSLQARFDAKLLRRAVRNLLENALRASAGGGQVEVRLERRDGMARIAVLDRGPGVPPDQLARIFDPYFSTHDSGTGLGLPISRRIAEEHGGTITAENRAEGGLEVAILIPTGPEGTQGIAVQH